MHITPDQIKASYEAASQVYDGQLASDNAANMLHGKYGLNINSARDAIGQYGCLMRGEVFKRSMSASALEYCLKQIETNRGRAAVQFALLSAGKHIKYYEGIRDVRLNKFRSVIEACQSRLSTPVTQDDFEKLFAKTVTQSLRDSSNARNKRLQNASKIPMQIVTTSKVYVRNADVVAAVLLRANGSCELCNKPAPFTRKSDGTPFLEVHHKKWLANGGEDSVENAIALCPNCHRQQHLG